MALMSIAEEFTTIEVDGSTPSIHIYETDGFCCVEVKHPLLSSGCISTNKETAIEEAIFHFVEIVSRKEEGFL